MMKYRDAVIATVRAGDTEFRRILRIRYLDGWGDNFAVFVLHNGAFRCMHTVPVADVPGVDAPVVPSGVYALPT